MTSNIPSRPTHTGSARAEALRTKKLRTQREPSHLITARAAIALDPAAEPTTPKTFYRSARNPLDLGRGRQAVALRQTQGDAIEVAVRSRDGVITWRNASGVIRDEILLAWIKRGF